MCLYVAFFQIMKQLIDFDEILCEYYAFERRLRVVVLISYD
jgi:hypothetical protein